MHLTGNELARAAWTQAWQVTLLIVVVGLLVRLFARNRPHLGHVLWLVVLIKCVTPPVFVSSSGVFCWMQAQADERSTPLAMAEDPPVEHWAIVDPPDLRPAVEMEHVLEPVAETSGGRMVVENTVLNTPRIETTAPDVDRAKLISWTLLGGWFVGSIVMLGVMVVRWIACLRRIRPIDRPVDASYDRMVRSLSRRLRLWRRARLVVTESRVGPAVIGLFRPTVLLPEILVREQSAEELEPILAHELIHIRRGDTWVGLLRTMARVVWWFHPLVWWADRLVAREAERCCDEAVVAELGCSPARYARCLFDVLQRKLVLNPLPACPGVRPVEVTSKRMERIMKLGQRSLKRSPWWCWAVLLLALAATLPGAALVAGDGDDESPQTKPIDAQPLYLHPPASMPVDEKSSAEPKAGAPVPSTGPSEEPLVTRIYSVGGLLAKIQSEQELDRKGAREYLLRAINNQRILGPGHSRRHAGWRGNRLVFRETARSHKHLAAALETARTHGFAQIGVDVSFITLSAETMNALGIRWTPPPWDFGTTTVHGQFDVPGAPMKRPFPTKSPHRTQARSVEQTNLPVRFGILDSQEAAAIVKAALSDRRTKVLRAPTLTVFNGRMGWVNNTSQSPFVVGVQEKEPLVQIVTEGTIVRLLPVLRQEGGLRLDCRLTQSRILAVEEISVDGSDQTSATVQFPVVNTREVDTGVELSFDQAVLIGGLRTGKDADGNPQAMMVMLQPRKVGTVGFKDRNGNRQSKKESLGTPRDEPPPLAHPPLQTRMG